MAKKILLRTDKDRKSTEEERISKQYWHHQFVKRWGFFPEAEGVDKEWFTLSPTVIPEDDPEYLRDMCCQIDSGVLFSNRGLLGNLLLGPTSIGLFALGRVMRSERYFLYTLLWRKV